MEVRREWQAAVNAVRRRGPLRVEHEALRAVGVCTGHTGYVVACAWAPDGSALVTTSVDQTARVWSAGDWSCLATLTGHEREVYACAWAPDGSALVTASFDETARVWRAGDWSCLATLTDHEFGLDSCAWAPDGSALFTTWEDTVRVWSDL